MSDCTMPAVRCVRFDGWPDADRAAFRRAQNDDELLDEAGLLARLRPISLLKLRSAYGRWLHFLESRDSTALTLAPAERITRERTAAYIEDLHARNAPLTLAHRIVDLYLVVRALAPEHNWGWLRRLGSRLMLRAKPVRNRRSQLRPPQEVFAAALALMDTAETGSFTSDGKRALAFRDALLLAILASRGPRVGNLGIVQIGRHLVRQGDTWALDFSASETKNGDPNSYELPRELTTPIQRYLDHWRPMLLGGNQSDQFWVSSNG
jgi:hypothetical protein